MDFDNILIEGEKLIVDNEFREAMAAIHEDNKNVFVTGSAGTGKTFFLKALCEISDKKKIILAPTGIAALNAGGSTIHSQFKFPFYPLVMSDNIFRLRQPKGDVDRRTIFNTFQYNKYVLELFKELEMIVIDEISMVRCDVITAIDWLLKVFRNNYTQPFGGVQVILIGDPFQLPPIVKKLRPGEPGEGDDKILRKGGYRGRFFFSTKVFEDADFKSFELTNVKRQSDPRFVNLLNKIRRNIVTGEDVQRLNSRVGSPDNDKGFIYITTTNTKVDNINSRKLDLIPFELCKFNGIIKNNFPEKDLPAPVDLKLKKGAQVMVLRNLYEIGLRNGNIGEVYEISDDKIHIKISGSNQIYEIERQVWSNERFIFNSETKSVEKEVIGTFTQFPLRLAWAITVHKSQGMSFDKVVADLNYTFDYGQVYVGLSRCRSFDNLYLTSPINRYQMNQHERVLRFFNSLNL